MVLRHNEAAAANSSTTTSLPSKCQVCHKAAAFKQEDDHCGDGETTTTTVAHSGASSPTVTKLLRCSHCKCRYYCSRTCQRRDWQRHKQACQYWRAAAAWNDLQTMVAMSDLQQARHDGQLAQHQVDRLQQNDNDTKSMPSMTGSTSTSSNGMAASLQSVKGTVDEATVRPGGDATTTGPNVSIQSRHFIVSRSVSDRKADHDETLSSGPASPAASVLPIPFWLEHLWHLKCYKLSLLLDDSISADELDLKCEGRSNNTSILTISHSEQSWQVVLDGMLVDDPRCVHVATNNPFDNRTLVHIRLSYDGDVSEPWPMPRLLQPSHVQQLACGTCRQAISDGGVQGVALLPNARWDELGDDYLSCHPGQAVADFGAMSAMVQPNMILYNDTIVMLHTNNVRALTVLAVPPYGEPESKNELLDPDILPPLMVRGHVPWRAPMAETGGTVCCAICCTVLGTAAGRGNAVCLYQHRIICQLDTASHLANAPLLSRVTTFVLHEMVRAADTHAVFAMAVNSHNVDGRLLLLRLLSWDGVGATTTGNDSNAMWRRQIKLLWDDQLDVPAKDAGADPTSLWTWTLPDWCCTTPGMASANHGNASIHNKNELAPASVVHVAVDADEWWQLHNDLQEAAQWHDPASVHATILAKTGNMDDSRAQMATFLL